MYKGTNIIDMHLTETSKQPELINSLYYLPSKILISHVVAH